jgi:flagellar M-ring protein FliF
VASAVEGLAPDQVTVVDDRGGLLNKPRSNADLSSAPDAQIEYRMALERSLVTKLTQTLDPVLGFGNYRTGVSVDVDFSGIEESEEVWDPTQSVMVSSQLTEEGSGGGRLSGGVPGTAANSPDPPAQTAPRTGTSRRSESANYQSSRRVRHVQQPRGAVKRITLALLLNQESHWEGEGADAQLVFTPPAQEKIDVIRNLASNVAGVNPERGDQITVESLPFDALTPAERPAGEAPEPALLERLMQDTRVLGGGAAVVILLLGGVGWFVMRRRGKGQPALAAAAAAGQVGAPAQESRALPSEPKKAGQLIPAPTGDTEEDLLASLRLATKSPVAAEALTKYLREEVNKDPQNATQLLRAWLEEDHAR